MNSRHSHNENLDHLLKEVDRLELLWSRERWVALIFSLFLIFFGFYFSGTPSGGSHAEADYSPLYLSVLGAALLGALIRNWHGEKKLILLRAFKQWHLGEIKTKE